MADQHIFSVQTKRTSLNSPSVLCNFIWGMGVRGDGWGARFSGTLASAGRDAAGPPTLRVSCILFPSVGEEADEPSLLVLTGVTREAGGGGFRQQGVISAASFLPSLSSAGTQDLM